MKPAPVKIAFILLWMMCTNHALAQSRYRFFTLGMEQGLTSDFVWSVCQDKYNYIWIGTANGLNRYDGHSIKQYFHNPNDSFSLPGNSIYWMHKDHDGDLWFSLGWAGVAKYNYAKDRFEKFAPFDSIKKKNNYPAPLWRMGADQQNRLYFACGAACFRYTKSTGKMEDLTPLFKGQVTRGVAMFLPQGNDLLWILTDDGLFRFDLPANEISKITFDKEKMGFGSEGMHDGEFINDHVILLSVERAGFVLFDTRTSTFSLPPSPLDPTITKQYSETGGVLKDSKGRIWLANSRYGLLEYLPATNSIYSLKNEASYPYPYKEQEGSGMHVYEDNQGNIWYGNSNKGVVWFSPGKDFVQVFERDYSKPHSLPHNSVTCFLPLGNNKVMIGTNYGITTFDNETNGFKNFPVAINSTDNYPNRYIRYMVKTNDSVIISTNEGLSIYHTVSDRFSRFIDNELARDRMPYGQWMINQVASRRIFIEGKKLVEFDLKLKKLISPTGPAKLDSLIDINASWFHKPTHTFWLEAGMGQLYSFNPGDNKLELHHFTRDSILMIDAIRCDTAGIVWLATSNGLYNYDPLQKKGKKIQLQTAVPHVYNIALQGNEIIWLSTSNEIIKYTPGNGKETKLSVNELFPNGLIQKRAFMLDDKDYLWVGTSKGFGKIDTRRFVSKKEFMKPQLVKFSVFDEERIFKEPLTEVSHVELKHDENFFSFQLSSFNFPGGNQVRYSYFLENFDKDWRQALSNTGSYTNVPPGTYRLRLRSAGHSGEWVEMQKPITLIIHPPFWKTPWFIICILVIVIVLLYFLYRFLDTRNKKARIESAIEYFANSLYGDNNVTEICWDIARNCISQLKLKDCVVYLVDDKKNTLVQVAAYGTKNPKEHEIINPLQIEMGKGIVGTVAQTGTYLLINDTRKDDRYIVDDVSRRSELAVPIIHEGKTIGVIDTEHPEKGFYNHLHIKALTTIAAISASKIAEAKAEQSARETEIKLLEINKLLAESQLMALRAQMNPHFVFNCLNSIQEFILTENFQQASLYLNKFSKLFRSVLNNSGKVLITLTEEMEALDMYLSLEHMRFEQAFNYKIDIDEDLELDDILIPSMLLQPYVENALWHGLMHKKGERALRISFNKINEDIFQCVVEDNGIGRKKAMEIKQQEGNTRKHVSRGMGISKDRVNLLQKQGHHAVLDIIDKYDEAGNAGGTKVVIELSTFLNT